MAKSGRLGARTSAANAESVGLLMAHCRSAKAFLHCSSTGVYDPPDDELRAETRRPGRQPQGRCCPRIRISKIAGEVVARTDGSRARIADHHRSPERPVWRQRRLAVFPHGDDAGRHPIPVPPGGPARYNPIHEDDIIAMIPELLEAASVPATTVNWAGEQTVSMQDWCAYLGALVGREPTFEESDQTLRGVPTDVTRMHELIGPATVGWREGMRRMAASSTPNW